MNEIELALYLLSDLSESDADIIAEGELEIFFENSSGGEFSQNYPITEIADKAIDVIDDLQKQNQQLVAQNAELVAMVEAMSSAMTNACNETSLSAETEQAQVVYRMESVLAVTPTQHLRDRDAEVEKKGADKFIAFLYSVNVNSESKVSAWADQYAEKIRGLRYENRNNVDLFNRTLARCCFDRRGAILCVLFPI